MEIELGPFPKYENVRSNAYWTRIHLDTTMWPDVHDAITYKAHLQDCIDNPTVGFLARRKYITGTPMNFPEYAWRNRKIMEKNFSIKATEEYLKSLINSIYPKTKHIRKYIIDSERMVLDEVTRTRKYTTWDKLAIWFMRFK